MSPFSALSSIQPRIDFKMYLLGGFHLDSNAGHLCDVVDHEVIHGFKIRAELTTWREIIGNDTATKLCESSTWTIIDGNDNPIDGFDPRQPWIFTGSWHFLLLDSTMVADRILFLETCQLAFQKLILSFLSS